jgi:hypothetical protein
MKDCSICKYCDEDFIFDEEIGEEYPVYSCQKGNDTSFDCECKDFKKYKPRKYKERDTECDICEYKEKCAKYSSGLDCTTCGDVKKHIVYPQDKCIKRAYDSTGLNNKLEHMQIDIDQWFRLANMPADAEIENVKKAKERGVEIPKNIADYFKKYGV